MLDIEPRPEALEPAAPPSADSVDPDRYTIRTRATDDSANVENSSNAIAVKVSSSTTYSLFNTSPGAVNPDLTASDNINGGDPRPVELGIEFTPSVAGVVAAIRFYKGLGDTGAHSGALWTASGSLLASTAFSNETASGWQTLTFAQPVSVAAGTSYIAGYHSSGNFPLASNYFKSPVSSGPLSTAAVTDGPSLYAYSSTATFPNQNGHGRNYWVDVVFQPPTAGVNYTDPATGVSGVATASAYSDPNVPNLQYAYLWTSSDGVAISTATPNMFMHGGAGNDALAVSNGSNVLDGGPGSNFLTGGTGADGGKDQFFVDGRGGQVTYSTIVNFHPGDTATIFGFVGGQSTSRWEATGGIGAYQGATLHSALSGPDTTVNASLTFAGIDITTASAHFQIVAGGSNTGNPFLLITYI